MRNILNNIKNNWKSGLSVALVSIPLAISLAIASNTRPLIGLITAIWAGFGASIFAGSNYNIIGPTGALAGILATYSVIYGPNALSILAIISGLFILLAFIFKLEKYLIFIPSSTIQGFILGIALIISLNQMNAAFGITNLPTHEKFIRNCIETIKNIDKISITTFIFFLVILISLFIFTKLFSKIPSIVLVTPISTVIGYLSAKQIIPFSLETLEAKFPQITSPEALTSINFIFYPKLMIPGITIALIAIIETMISARIADGITKTKHNKRKEIFSLGFANIISGLAGGIPATAALARTSLNIKTGATHKTSAFICSIFVLLITLTCLPYFKYLPLAAVAAILVYTAINMVEKEHFIKMYKLDKKSFFISIIVALISIYEDPIIGIFIGATISMLLFMMQISEGQFELMSYEKAEISKEKLQLKTKLQELIQDPKTLIYTIKGQLAYINSQSHIARFERQPITYSTVILNLKDLLFIDLDGVDAIIEITKILKAQNKRIFICGLNPFIQIMLRKNPEYLKLEKEKVISESCF